MKKLFLLNLLLVGFFALNLAAQDGSKTVSFSPKTLNEVKQMQDAALASDYAYRQTAYLCNNIGPRLSGSPQAQRAVEYVADEMKKLGLEVRLQKTMVPHWVRGEEKAELIEFDGMAPGTTQKIVITALGGTIPTDKTGLIAEVVVVKNYEELAALGKSKVEGKIVLFDVKFDRRLSNQGQAMAAYGQVTAYRGGGAIEAAKLGAVGVLVRSAGGSQNRLAHTGGMRYTEGVAKIPAAAVSYEDAELMAYLAKMGKVKIRMTLTPQTLPDAVSYNVIADLKGSEKPDEFVVVSGHLDSWDLGTGAIDDASGVAVSMQVAYLAKKLNLKPKRTIRVVAYMNEENGLMGGKTYGLEEDAAKHFAMIESDLGAGRPLGYYYAGKSEIPNILKPLSTILGSQGASLFQQQGGVGADIGPMTEKGVPSFAPWFDTSKYFDYHHNAADTFDKIDPQDLAMVGAWNAVLAYGLANMEQNLPR